jgi:hypothetical protein
MKRRSIRNPQNNRLNTAENEVENHQRGELARSAATVILAAIGKADNRSFKLRSAEQVVWHSHIHATSSAKARFAAACAAAHLTIELPCDKLFASCNAIFGLQMFVAHISHSQSDLLHSKAAETPLF